jgi:hypothetical protein
LPHVDVVLFTIGWQIIFSSPHFRWCQTQEYLAQLCSANKSSRGRINQELE